LRLRAAPALAIDACFRAVSVRPLAGLRVGLPLLLLFHLVWLSDEFLNTTVTNNLLDCALAGGR
jgi:hypothetical protein